MRRQETYLSFAPQAWRYALPLAALAIGAAVPGWGYAAAPLAILAGYVLYFYRDPGRHTPNIPGSLVSPADGKVVSTIEVPCPEMPGGRAMRVAIFLNIFNVHIQRMPHRGTIRSITRRPGKFINALNEKCSEENEAVTVWWENDEGVFGVRQIAGAIARRIVCELKPGDEVERGERYGLIHFGSRAELFLPVGASIKVEPGQHVRAGETILALLYEEDVRKGRALSRDSNAVPPA